MTNLQDRLDDRQPSTRTAEPPALRTLIPDALERVCDLNDAAAVIGERGIGDSASSLAWTVAVFALEDPAEAEAMRSPDAWRPMVRDMCRGLFAEAHLNAPDALAEDLLRLAFDRDRVTP